MNYYVTKMPGTRFVGAFSLETIRESVAAGRFKAAWFATESDGRSFTEFSKSEAGDWRTLQTLLAMDPEEIAQLVAKVQSSIEKRTVCGPEELMTPGQKAVVFWWLVIVVAIGLFPPCLYIGSSSVLPHPEGHAFLFQSVYTQTLNGLESRVPLIDTGRLHTYWAIVTAVSALIVLLIQWSRPQQTNSLPIKEPHDSNGH